jgi:hypothetical protein
MDALWMASPYSAQKNRLIAFSLAMGAIAFANAPRLAGRSLIRNNSSDRASFSAGLLGQRLVQFR